ncbi:MAG: GGDEF domain-containing protein [Gammaproteobacteria bacterium]
MPKKPTFEAASEYLRQALPLMSMHKIPVAPLNYAVWYEYVSGGSAGLRESIDRMTAADEPIDEQVTEQLYQQFIDPSDKGRVEAAHHTLRKILKSMHASLNEADSEVVRYGQSLHDCNEKLSDDITVEDLRAVVDGLISSTHHMHESNEALHRHLEESRQEADQLRAELERARVEAKSDVLTGLANRKGFEERVRALETGENFHGQSHCLLIGDIDHFKGINDSYGHIFGDKIIKVVATAFANLTKGKDLAARFGGEEFVTLLPQTDIEGGKAVAEAIRSSIERGRVYNPKTGEEIRRITISVGVTEIVHGESIDTTIARADEALYRAKEAGRNRVEVALPDVAAANVA